jgi:hypothetical protein
MSDHLEFCHCALVVPDLRAAQLELAERFGLTFTEVIESKRPYTDAGSVELATAPRVLVAYSRPGRAPYLELIQVLEPGGPYSAQDVGVHHFGFWTDDVWGTARALRSAGQSVEYHLLDGPDLLALFSPVSALLGVRVEYTSARFRPVIEGWVATGHYPTASRRPAAS